MRFPPINHRINRLGPFELTDSTVLNRSRTFIHNVGWNLVGQIAPLFAALVSIPLLIKGMGIDRFGILTIGWMLIGYFSLFDLGIGRALTQVLSEKLATGKHEDVPPLIWSGLAAMLVLGMLASLMIMGLSDPIIYSWLNIPAPLQAEAKRGLFMLAPSIPMVLLATGLRGILEAKQAFKAVNLVRIPLGVLTFVAPLCVLSFSNSLEAVFLTLMLVRLVTLLMFFYLCHRTVAQFNQVRWSGKVLPELFRFGGWMTVSNIVSPIMVQMDRFIIGAMLTMAAVAYYATPYEMISKLLVVPGAIAGVCFPSFANFIARRNFSEADALYRRSCKYTLLLLAPVVLACVVLAGWILGIWIGPQFSQESAAVFRILAVGMLINGVAHIPFAYLQGAGRSDLTAKLHVAEVIVYLPLLLAAVKWYGIVGAAGAWTLRVAIDAAALHYAVAVTAGKAAAGNRDD